MDLYVPYSKEAEEFCKEHIEDQFPDVGHDVRTPSHIRIHFSQLDTVSYCTVGVHNSKYASTRIIDLDQLVQLMLIPTYKARLAFRYGFAQS